MRPLTIMAFIFCAIVVLFQLRLFLEKETARIQSLRPPESSLPIPEQSEFDKFILPIVRTWNFEAFREAVDPALKQQVPEEDLKVLFQGVAYKLGPLVYYKGSQRVTGAASGNPLFRAEAVFLQGEAVLEVQAVQSSGKILIQRFAVESSKLEGVENLAQASFHEGKWDASAFRRGLAA